MGDQASAALLDSRIDHAVQEGGKVEFEFYGQEDLERLLEAWGVM